MKQIKISVQIMLVFIVAILFSLIPNLLPSLMGDEICNGTTIDLTTNKIEYYLHYGSTHHEIVIHWGYQHWLFFYMGISLFITQVVFLIKEINEP